MRKLRSLMNYCGALVACLFLIVAGPSPALADDGWHCHSCEMCYSPTPFCTSCGVMTVTAISGCCGMGNGEAYCVPDYGGFAVNCASGTKSCQCNMNGNDCDPLTVAGG